MKEKEKISYRKRNFIPWNRNWKVVKRHTPIIVKPLITGLVSILIWRFIICRFELSFDESAENSLLFIAIVFACFTYGMFATYAVNTVLGEYKEISKAVVKNDMDAFLLYRDEQLPILVHLLLITASLFLLFFIMLFPYHSLKEGAEV